MAGAKNHPYHLVNPSIWPITGSFAGLVLFGGMVMWMHGVTGGAIVLGAGLVGVLFTMFAWWAEVIKEAHAGDHTPVVQLHLRYGMILFIASEVMFFLAWFWAYFNAALFPPGVESVGGTWPPKGMEVLDPFGYAPQHLDPALLGNDGDLGAPRPHPRRPRRADQGAVGDDRSRPAVHRHPGL
jgi:cytochrome c oxidase subunit 3